MNVLVVDDQIHVVEGIINEIDWKRLGIREVFRAYSAADAQKILQSYSIEIMLCDIEMPGENGLSLLKWTLEQGLESECIFLTAHADFGYARTAMKLGSIDYILQPARYEEIENAILKARQRYLEKREQKKFYSYGKEFFSERHRMLDQCLREWYEEPRERERFLKIRSYMQNAGWNAQHKGPEMIMLFQVLSWEGEPWDSGLLCASCVNILDELMKNERIYSCMGRVDEKLWMIFLTEQEDRVKCGTEIGKMSLESDGVYQKVSIFYQTVSQFFGCRLALYADIRKENEEPDICLGRLKKRHTDNVAMLAGFYGEEKRIKASFENERPDFKEWERLLSLKMGKEVYNQAVHWLDKMVELRILSAQELLNFYQGFYTVLCLVEEKTKTERRDIFPEEEQRKEALCAYENLFRMKSFLKTVTAYFTEEDKDTDNAIFQVEEMKNYIHQNLENDIRREEVAEHVFMNPNYVSRLFKRVEGISLKEYIIREKMIVARTLLQNSNLPVSIVALKVGYGNFSHFSQVYKKMYGISPTEERQKKQV